MNLFFEAIEWIFAPERATSALPLSEAITTHLLYTFISVLIAAAIAIPAGWAIGHTGRGRGIAVALAGAARAIPSFGLVLLLVTIVGVLYKVEASIVAFVLLAIPPILAGAYAGIDAIDRKVIDGARSVGMNRWQVLFKVEAPLGLPLLVGGIRSATLQVVSTVTLMGYIGNWGLGFYIVQGIPLNNFSQILGAALIIVVLAVVLDGLLALAQRLAIPHGVTAGRTGETRARKQRRPAEQLSTT